MNRYIRFIVRTDHQSRTKCTGVVASLRIIGEEGRLPAYHMNHADELFGLINSELPCPPFDDKNWDSDCVCWFKDTSQKWISIFREMAAILEDSDIEVATLTTSKPGMIVYEDDFQVVAKSSKY